MCCQGSSRLARTHRQHRSLASWRSWLRVVFTTEFTADVDGEWEFSLASIGYTKLWIDGTLVIDNEKNRVGGELFFGLGSEEVRSTISLKAGQTCAVEVRQWSDPVEVAASPLGGGAGIRVGAYPVIDAATAIKDAAALAKDSDGTPLLFHRPLARSL